MYRDRGFIVGYHKLMVQADPDWLERYGDLIHATYLEERTLDRKTKELCQTVVLAALRSSTDHIGSHIRMAMAHGATKEEVLEALECVLLPLGGLGFNAGLQAWADVSASRSWSPKRAGRGCSARGPRHRQWRAAGRSTTA